MKKLLPFVKTVLLTTAAFMFISGISILAQAVSGVSQLTEAPAETMPAVPRLASPTLLATHAVITPALSAESLFKEAKVTAEVSKLSSPETFRKVKVFTQVEAPGVCK